MSRGYGFLYNFGVLIRALHTRSLEAKTEAGIIIGRRSIFVQRLYYFLASLSGRIFGANTVGYLQMQKAFYENSASQDSISSGSIEKDNVVGSWSEHNEWKDYEDYLMRYVPLDSSWTALEYGCGPGRNIVKWSSRFKRIDGVDIAQSNLDNVSKMGAGVIREEKKPRLYLTEGSNCSTAEKNYYDFAFSTICLQHICVHEVRFKILSSLFEVLKPGGRLSFQMGYGSPSPQTVPYHANFYEALGTNRMCDVEIADHRFLYEDLAKIGFQQIEHWIRPVGPGDIHPSWIFCTAVKPL